ncbi:MAG: GIY-YIG nuclease family protein [Alphaproteobacteria bacterium]|nr:GIY-YIG nuclease family protein [Alphaproteobacteria bacterium]
MSNRPGGVLYIGVTSNLGARISQQRQGLVPGFARRHKCQRLVWFERHDDLQDARVAEVRMKRWKRDWKIKRIVALIPRRDDLSETLND